MIYASRAFLAPFTALSLVLSAGLPSVAMAQWSKGSALSDEDYCARLGISRGSEGHRQCVINMRSVRSPESTRGVQEVQSSSSTVSHSPGAKKEEAKFDPVRNQETGTLNPTSQMALADAAYQRGDKAEAFRLTLAAARAGNASAQSLVAWHYSQGVGTEVDQQKSIYWLIESSKNNDPRGIHNLSVAYLNGQGVNRDIQKSFEYAAAANSLGFNKSLSVFDEIRKLYGENHLDCMKYGFRLGTAEFSQCLMQIDQAQLQSQMAQRQYDLEMRRYEQQVAMYEAQKKALKEAERKRRSDYFMRMSQGLLSGESFAEASMAAEGMPLTRPTRPEPPRVNNIYIERPFICFPTAASLNCRPRP